MGAVGSLLRGARRARPVIASIQRAEAGALAGGEVAILSKAGDEAVADRLRALIGAPSVSQMPREALWVHAASPGSDPRPAADALAEHRRSRGRALAILVGPRSAREAMEPVFLATGLEASNLAQVASLEGPGGRDALRAVAIALEEEATAAGRRYHALRPAVARLLVERSARRAGAIGAVEIFPGTDLATLALMHVQLLAELSALYERSLGAERAVEAAVVVGAGFGWRALARAGLGVFPGPAWMLRGGVAYATTRALGEAAVARLESGGEVLGERPAELIRERLGGVASRLGLG